MHPSVKAIFPGFSTTFEGRVSWMYLDIKGLVTIGIGNLIDPVQLAILLPFVHDGTLTVASEAEIHASFNSVKARQDLRKCHFSVFAKVSPLRLTDQTIDNLVLQQLERNVTVLSATFPGFETWPADAQLGLASMAWAMGAGFTAKWPRFSAACRALDFDTAARECQMDARMNPGLVARNHDNYRLFQNAARVIALGLPAETLQFPNDLAGTNGTPSQGDEPTS
jgi:GH24 family phage-related lysozyme (muramidase)